MKRATIGLSLAAALCLPTTMSPADTALDAADSPDAPAQLAGDHGDYLEVKEERGRHVALRVAVREFAPANAIGPLIALVSVTHIGEQSFYEKLDKKLHEYDLVLFEAVGPPGTQPPTAADTDEERATRTLEAMRFIASILEAHHQEHERYPVDAEELHRSFDRRDAIISNWAHRAMTDGWGRPLVYEADDEGRSFELRSEGAPGNAEPGEPLRVTSGDETITPLPHETSNLQKQLADALGLAYQMNSLSYGSANWRPSDMHARQLAEALRKHGANFDVLEPMAGGASFPARLAQLLLRAIAWLDAIAEGAVSDTIKVVMIEMLGDPQLIEHSLGQLGEGFQKVIVGERNQVVIDDIARIMREEPEVKSIAVLYGAAHMADFAQRLDEQLQYEPRGEPHWLTAINVDLTQSPMTPAQIERMRITIRRMLQQQMRQMQRRE